MELGLLQFDLTLIIAAILALVAIKFGQSSIAGYLLAGALARFFLAPSETLHFLSFLGSILLLFFVGLEFSINKVRNLGKKIFFIGLLDLLINFPLGILCGIIFKWNWMEIIFLGGIVYISSSAVISKLLADAGCLTRRETKTVLGVLIIEDIIMAVLLAVFSALAQKPSLEYLPISIAIAKAVGFCLIFFIFEKPIRSFINFVLNVEPDEIFVLEIIGIIFIVSLGAKFIGLSEAIGAFFIGSAMAESHHKNRIHKLLKPLGLFSAALFFISFGLQVNLLAIDTTIIFMVTILIIVSILGKLVTGLLSAPIEGLSFREAQNVGFSLFSRGEFSILIATLFVVNNTSSYGIKEITAIYVFFLMILSSFLIKRYTVTCQVELPIKGENK